MNKFLSLAGFTLFTVLFMAGCASSSDGSANISIGTALGYFFQQTSYVVTLVIATVIAAILAYSAYKNYDADQDWGTKQTVYIALAVLIFLFALLYAPAEAAANTTVEMFQRTGTVIR